MSLWSTTEKPKHLTDAEKALVVGVDSAEAAANNLNAGWVSIQEYTDAQGNPRRKSVTLVAMGSIPSDGDTSIVDDLTGGSSGAPTVYSSAAGDWTGTLSFDGMTNRLGVSYGNSFSGSLLNNLHTIVGDQIEFTVDGGGTFTTTITGYSTDSMTTGISLQNAGWGMMEMGTVTSITITPVAPAIIVREYRSSQSDFSSVEFNGGQIVMTAYDGQSLYDLLNGATNLNGATITGMAMAMSFNVTLTSDPTFDPMAAGGSGAWVASYNVVEGSPSGPPSYIYIRYPG